jgi:hypothetical protein
MMAALKRLELVLSDRDLRIESSANQYDFYEAGSRQTRP